MTKVDYTVTNQELFNATICDIDTTGLIGSSNQNTFTGSLSIEKEDGEGWITITGEFGADDYEQEFGFVLVEQKED